MKTFNASQLNQSNRREIFEAAKEEGAIIQRKNTNGDVLEEFVMVNKAELLELLWNNYSTGDRNNEDVCDLIERINDE